MSTSAQKLANQANAQHSSGPQTETGKAASAVNNRKYGLAGAFFLLPDEDEAQFHKLTSDLVEEHQPSTRTELILVEKMAQHYWTSQRAQWLQNPYFQNGRDAQSFSLFLRYQTTHDRAFQKCLDQLLKLRAERRKEQIGFESQKRRQAAIEATEARKQAEENRREEVHYAKTRLLNSKAALTELDASLKRTFEAKFPGNTAIPFNDIKPFLQSAIQDFVNYKTAKAA